MIVFGHQICKMGDQGEDNVDFSWQLVMMYIDV